VTNCTAPRDTKEGFVTRILDYLELIPRNPFKRDHARGKRFSQSLNLAAEAGSGDRGTKNCNKYLWGRHSRGLLRGRRGGPSRGNVLPFHPLGKFGNALGGVTQKEFTFSLKSEYGSKKCKYRRDKITTHLGGNK